MERRLRHPFHWMVTFETITMWYRQAIHFHEKTIEEQEKLANHFALNFIHFLPRLSCNHSTCFSK